MFPFSGPFGVGPLGFNAFNFWATWLGCGLCPFCW